MVSPNLTPTPNRRKKTESLPRSISAPSSLKNSFDSKRGVRQPPAGKIAALINNLLPCTHAGMIATSFEIRVSLFPNRNSLCSLRLIMIFPNFKRCCSNLRSVYAPINVRLHAVSGTAFRLRISSKPSLEKSKSSALSASCPPWLPRWSLPYSFSSMGLSSTLVATAVSIFMNRPWLSPERCWFPVAWVSENPSCCTSTLVFQVTAFSPASSKSCHTRSCRALSASIVITSADITSVACASFSFDLFWLPAAPLLALSGHSLCLFQCPVRLHRWHLVFCLSISSRPRRVPCTFHWLASSLLAWNPRPFLFSCSFLRTSA